MISGDEVCWNAVFGTLVGVSVFSDMWSELLMTSAISCPRWSSVYECQSEDRMWYSGNMLDAVLYVFVGCFVVRGCAVTRRYIDVCDCDMFGVV